MRRTAPPPPPPPTLQGCERVNSRTALFVSACVCLGIQVGNRVWGKLAPRTFVPNLTGDAGLLAVQFWRSGKRAWFVDRLRLRIRALASRASAAACIQSVFKMKRTRRLFIVERDRARKAAIEIQRIMRGVLVRKFRDATS